MMSDPVDRTYPLYAHPLLRATALLQDNRIRIEAKGPLAKIPSIKTAFDMFDNQIPAYARDNLCISTWIPPIPSKAFDRLRKSRIKSIFGKRTPDQVTISITEDCPNKCVHCALPDTGQRLRLEPDIVKDVVDQVLDLGTTLVIFDGGEPATYRELPDLVRSVDDRAIATLFTSGVGFTSSLAKKLKSAGLYAVNLSLDSSIQEEHDQMRGRVGTFKDAMFAAKHALKAGLLLDIYVVLRRDNIHQLQEFHELAKQVGAHELTFFEIVPVGRWASGQNAALSKSDHLTLDSFASRSHGLRIFSVPAAFHRFGCFAGRNWLHITPAGEVYPCACMPHIFGNIKYEPISKIWRRMAHLPFSGSRICPMRRIN